MTDLFLLFSPFSLLLPCQLGEITLEGRCPCRGESRAPSYIHGAVVLSLSNISLLPSLSASRLRADEPRSALYCKVAKKAHLARAKGGY